MTVRRLTIEDLPFVEAVMLHDDVFPYICDDASFDKNRFSVDLPRMLDNSNLYFLSSGAGCVYMLNQFCGGTYVVHTCITPQYRGKTAIEYGMCLIKHCFCDLMMSKLISYVPAYNRRALLYALKCGFSKEGFLTAAWQRGGITHDINIVGLSISDYQESKCQQQR